MSTAADHETRIDDIPGLSNSRAMELARVQLDALIGELETLSEEDWDRATDCERWSVRDVVAHILGWAEALTSPREMLRLTRDTRRIRKELDVKLDAQNEAQVIARRHLTPAQLIERLRASGDRFLRVRRNVGFAGKAIPMYHPAVGPTNVRFMLGQIFTRDHFMHRIDIARAAGKELNISAPERRMVTDIVRHWTRSSNADCRLVLTGPAGGTFVAGTGERATITGDAIEFCRLLAGRADPDVMEISGDDIAARRWLDARVPF